ncbi:MAG TPA: 50S ribosomal protein L6 [Proteobacteria bacterium]|nr:50S ribosomal protein L6 [bacterium BMS3Abin14]HDL54267.1 50S ribosomal protein L6 [Pseudomonadota bacterium]
MSRIGKQPVGIPDGVEVGMEGRRFTAKGALGQLGRDLPLGVDVEIDKEEIRVLPPSRPKETSAMQGLARTLIDNIVQGVSKGYEKALDMEGVGYRATIKGAALELMVGFSNPVVFPIPDGIKIEVDRNNRITIRGIDKEKVGQIAADIRAVRPPEPYKGKGIRYVNERIRRKAGKAGIT